MPLIVNHKHKYISFGTDNPQLCFLYTLTDETSGRSVKLYQRFIFNLNWSPEDFRKLPMMSRHWSIPASWNCFKACCVVPQRDLARRRRRQSLYLPGE